MSQSTKSPKSEITTQEKFKGWRTQNGVSGLWMMCGMIGGAITMFPAAFMIPKNASLWVVPIMGTAAIIMTIVVFVLSFIITLYGPFDFEHQTYLEDYN